MSYFVEALNGSRRNETIQAAIDHLSMKRDSFDAIAFTGISGACVAPILAYHFNKALLPIRKPRQLEPSHSCSDAVESGLAAPPSGYRILIVDDFIASGQTVRTMIDRLKSWNSASRVIAVYLYKNSAICNESYRKQKEASIHVPVWDRTLLPTGNTLS